MNSVFALRNNMIYSPFVNNMRFEALFSTQLSHSTPSTQITQHLRRLRYELLVSRDKLQRLSHIVGQHTGVEFQEEFLGQTKKLPSKKIANIGHKGAEGHIKGNTIASFHRAIDLGVDIIEFDVVVCSDGILCHHDAMHDDSGRWFKDMTIDEVRSIFRQNHPTLEEMLNDSKIKNSNVHLYFDLKHTEVVHPTMHAILDAVNDGGWSSSRFIVATFKQVELLEINAYRNSFPEIAELRTAAIFDAIPLSLAKEFEALGCSAISVGQHCVNPELVADCHRRGLQIWAWTVNKESMIKELIRLGIDGICTDYPERVAAATAAAAAASLNMIENGTTIDSTKLLEDISAQVKQISTDPTTVHESILSKLISSIYGVVNEARVPALKAIAEAKLMLSVIKESPEDISAYTKECAALERALEESESFARFILQPLITSSNTVEWLNCLSNDGKGSALLQLVSHEIRSNHTIPLLDFERMVLDSIKQQI